MSMADRRYYFPIKRLLSASPQAALLKSVPNANGIVWIYRLNHFITRTHTLRGDILSIPSVRSGALSPSRRIPSGR